MKFAQVAIGSILFIEAFLLMYSVEEKYNFHSFMELGMQLNYRLVKRYFTDCQWMQKVTFECTQKVRLFLVAFMITGGFSLTFGSSVFVGLLAQVMWTVTQSETYYSSGLKQTLATLTQVVFVLVLLGQTRNDWIRSQKLKKQSQQIKAWTASSQTEQPKAPKSEELKREEVTESKESQPLGYSEESSAATKSKKRKNK